MAIQETVKWTSPEEFIIATPHEDRFAAYKGMITCLRSFGSHHDAFIVGMCQGIARAFVARALEWAKSYGGDAKPFKKVFLNVVKDNVLARRVYEKCGFVAYEETENQRETRYVHEIEIK